MTETEVEQLAATLGATKVEREVVGQVGENHALVTYTLHGVKLEISKK